MAGRSSKKNPLFITTLHTMIHEIRFSTLDTVAVHTYNTCGRPTVRMHTGVIHGRHRV